MTVIFVRSFLLKVALEIHQLVKYGLSPHPTIKSSHSYSDTRFSVQKNPVDLLIKQGTLGVGQVQPALAESTTDLPAQQLTGRGLNPAWSLSPSNPMGQLWQVARIIHLSRVDLWVVGRWRSGTPSQKGSPPLLRNVLCYEKLGLCTDWFWLPRLSWKVFYKKSCLCIGVYFGLASRRHGAALRDRKVEVS